MLSMTVFMSMVRRTYFFCGYIFPFMNRVLQVSELMPITSDAVPLVSLFRNRTKSETIFISAPGAPRDSSSQRFPSFISDACCKCYTSEKRDMKQSDIRLGIFQLHHRDAIFLLCIMCLIFSNFISYDLFSHFRLEHISILLWGWWQAVSF